MAQADSTKSVDRLPPQAPDFERAVLGAMLIDDAAVGKAVEKISASDFFKPAHQVIFNVLTTLYDSNILIDELVVTEELKKLGKLDAVGGEAAISNLATETRSSANIEYHCDVLHDKAILRNIILFSSRVQNRAYEENADANEVLELIQSDFVEITQGRKSKHYVSVAEVINEAHKGVLEKAEAPNAMTGIDTGFNRLNKLTGGWQRSDLVIVAARPSMGKTALALDLAKNAAHTGVPVAVFSLEMSAVQLVQRMMFNEGRFDGSMLTKGEKPRRQDWTRLNDACQRLTDYPIFIDDTPGLSTLDLNAKAKRLKLEHDIGIIFIDYLQLMESSSRRESRQQEITAISRSLKGLAKELDVPVIALSQLSRGIESRTDHRPLLSDLRESGAIEQDADIVMFIYRASVYGDNPGYEIAEEPIDPSEVAEIIIRKQRNGPIGTILLHWIKEHTKFSEFTYMSTDEYF